MLEFEDYRALDNSDAVILVHYSDDERDDAGFLRATSHDAYGTVGLRNLDLESTQWLRDGPPIVEVSKSENTGARRVPLIKTNMAWNTADAIEFYAVKARHLLLTSERDGEYPLPEHPPMLP